MLGILLDAAGIIGLVMMLNDDSESPNFGVAALAGFAISIILIGATHALPLEVLTLLAVLLPTFAAISSGVLWIVFDVPPLGAVIGGVIFLVYKIVITVALVMMFRV